MPYLKAKKPAVQATSKPPVSGGRSETGSNTASLSLSKSLGTIQTTGKWPTGVKERDVERILQRLDAIVRDVEQVLIPVEEMLGIQDLDLDQGGGMQ